MCDGVLHEFSERPATNFLQDARLVRTDSFDRQVQDFSNLSDRLAGGVRDFV